MEKSKLSDEESNEIDIEQENSIEDVIDMTSHNENQKKRDDERKNDLDLSFKELKEGTGHRIHRINKLLKDEDLETQASKKYFPPGYSKRSHHRGHFTSLWVQYTDTEDLGYAYGGADPLNYEPSTKNRFLRIVFIIVCIFLMLTSGVIFYSYIMLPFREFFQDISGIFLVTPAAIVLFSMNCLTACSECARTRPFNFVCLFLSLIGVSIVTGFISGRFDIMVLFYTYLTTAFVSLAFVIIAFTPYNFTHWSLHIVGICLALPAISGCTAIAYYGLIDICFPVRDPQILIYTFIGALIQVLIMTAVLQMTLDSEAVEILENDYSLGAFYLYTSVYDIFIKIVQIIIYRIFGNDEE